MKTTIKILTLMAMFAALTTSSVQAQSNSRNNTPVPIVKSRSVVAPRAASARSPFLIQEQASATYQYQQPVQAQPRAQMNMQQPVYQAAPNNVMYSPSPAPSMDCGCQQPDCGGRCRLLGRRAASRVAGGCDSCGTDCGCVQCPRCEGDVCRLELDNSSVKKTCFKTEQVAICIPPVRFPWQKCPPATSKTRVITKLMKHQYECPNCSYKWKLDKGEGSAPIEAATAPTKAQPMETKPDSIKVVPAAGGSDVPAAPILKGAFRFRPWSKR